MANGWLPGTEPCPHCGSSDGVHTNTDDWKTCFVCQKRWKGSGSYVESPGKTPTSPTDFKVDVGGTTKPWTARKLSQDTCKLFDVEWCASKGVWVKWVHDDKGARVGSQWRYAPGHTPRFHNWGDVTGHFFGQRRARDGGKWLAITEGHEDAMALSQVLDHKYPVVSIPSGTGSVDKAFKKQCNWLAKFEKIVLFFDQDEPGQEALEKALAHLNRIRPGVSHVASLPYKDANDCLMNGAVGELRNAFWNAPKWQPPGFISMADLMEEALKEPDRGQPYPWDGLTKITYGRRPGEVITWAAGAGVGKTAVLSHITAKNLREGRRVGALFLEQPPHEMTQRILGVLYGKALHDPDVVTTDAEREEAKQLYRECGGEVVFYDASRADGGEKTWESTRDAIRYLVVAEGCTDIVLDNLTVLLDHNQGTDTELHVIMKELCADARRFGVGIDAVSHLRKEQKGNEQYDDGAEPRSSDLYGSDSIKRYSSFIFGLSRNKQSDGHEKNTLRVRCLKDRFTGKHDGAVISLSYDSTTGLLTEIGPDDQPPFSPVEGPKI